MADPCTKEQMTSNNKKINDVGKNIWLKLQDQAKLHDNQIKELVATMWKTNKGLSKWRPTQANGINQKWDLTSKSA